MMFSAKKMMKNHFWNFKDPIMQIIKKNAQSPLHLLSNSFLVGSCKILSIVGDTALTIATLAYLVCLAYLANLASYVAWWLKHGALAFSADGGRGVEKSQQCRHLSFGPFYFHSCTSSNPPNVKILTEKITLLKETDICSYIISKLIYSIITKDLTSVYCPVDNERMRRERLAYLHN